ncbi:unnamed protein product [Soboliphyme baturini]|uniref:Uncharacterized protein n=1 Tax=Soboliphyme baturini TaxID=241478 RepID=A0A183II40_9BILA|nr:unnamed protein product [Soboliphyme baturini]
MSDLTVREFTALASPAAWPSRTRQRRVCRIAPPRPSSLSSFKQRRGLRPAKVTSGVLVVVVAWSLDFVCSAARHSRPPPPLCVVLCTGDSTKTSSASVGAATTLRYSVSNCGSRRPRRDATRHYTNTSIQFANTRTHDTIHSSNGAAARAAAAEEIRRATEIDQ